MTTPSRGKVCDREEEENKNKPNKSGHYVTPQLPRAPHTLRLDQN
jgi:hypothetical protein